MNKATRERFWQRVEQRSPDECWPWTGPVNNQGYGVFYWTAPDAPKVPTADPRRSFKRKQSCTTASRMAYLLSRGVQWLPSHIEVCHRCDNPPCCNPAHLWAGTGSENQRDSVRKGRRGRKLKPADVREIRASKDDAYRTSDRFGISPSMVWIIRRGGSWSALDEAA